MTKTTKKNVNKQVKKAEEKKVDPKRRAAALRAWATIRAKRKEKQTTNKSGQNPLN